MFSLTKTAIDRNALLKTCEDVRSGGFVSFEGWVRDHNHDQKVSHLIYEAYPILALKEGERLVAEALERFDINQAYCQHRVGQLELTEMAVWVGVSSTHRAEAFEACQFIIDEIKSRVPIWKKEFYTDGQVSWVNCPRCQAVHE